MRKVYLFLFQALMALNLVCATGCSKDDPSNASVSDPDGIVTSNISENSSVQFYVNANYNGFVGWTEPNNFVLNDGWSYSYAAICDMGAKKGLGNITTIPKTGFTVPDRGNTSVACQKGHGYVVQFIDESYTGDTTYLRLYVVSSLVSTDGGVMGATVKYQYPFVP